MTSHDLTVAVFVVLALGFGVLEIAARVRGRVSTLDTVIGFAMRGRAGQIGMLLLWWWIGWHFFIG